MKLETLQKIRSEFLLDLPEILEGRDPYLMDYKIYKRVHEGSESLRGLSPRETFRLCCERLGVMPETIRGEARRRDIAFNRGAIINMLASKHPYLSTVQIGYIVNKDHTSIGYALRQHCVRLDDGFYSEMWQLLGGGE